MDYLWFIEWHLLSWINFGLFDCQSSNSFRKLSVQNGRNDLIFRSKRDENRKGTDWDERQIKKKFWLSTEFWIFTTFRPTFGRVSLFVVQKSSLFRFSFHFEQSNFIQRLWPRKAPNIQGFSLWPDHQHVPREIAQITLF